MSEQSTRYQEWIDLLLAGEKATVENFARTAIGKLPRVETKLARLDPAIWGDGPQDEGDPFGATCHSRVKPQERLHPSDECQAQGRGK